MTLNFPINITSKLQSWYEAQQTVHTWKANGWEVVFTNGCFDLLHVGHVCYLAQAQALGQKLVVGLNSDASVARLKGSHRPIKDVVNRQYVLASLQVVDLVVTFEDDTPYRLIEQLEPDVLVKGGDWSPDQIVGSELVYAYGGTVHSLPFVEGYSTTALEQAILTAHASNMSKSNFNKSSGNTNK